MKQSSFYKGHTHHTPLVSPIIKLRLFWKKHAATLLFILMLIGGFILRMYPLLTKNYLQDEMATLAFSQADYPLFNHLIYPLDDRPWLYYLFVKILYAIYPNTLFLRFVSLLVGLTSVIVAYIAIKKINTNLALATVFMLRFSLSRMDYSWQIRDMSLLLLLTSFLLLFGISLLQNVIKTGTWKRKQTIFITLSIAIGCLTNYIFIIFSISYVLFLGVSLYYLTKNFQTVLRFFFCITIQSLPLIALLTWYLFGQSDISDIVISNRWIPNATLFTFLSINSTLLGLTAYFDEFYEPTQDVFNQVLALNIGMGLFFVGTSIAFFKKKFAHISPLVPIYFFGGVFIYFFTYILVVFLSHILQVNMILHRTFIRSGTVFIFSFTIGAYMLLKTIIKQKYQQATMISLVAAYLLLFSVHFISYYQIHNINTIRFTAKGDVVDVIERYYESGDQIVFFPIHYQFLYIPFYYHNNPKYKLSSKLAYLKMREYNLENPILRKKLSLYSGDTPNTNKFNGKILFIEERTIFSGAPQGLPDENISQNTFLYQEIQKYCVEDPIWIDESANFIIRTCWFKPEYQFEL